MIFSSFVVVHLSNLIVFDLTMPLKLIYHGQQSEEKIVLSMFERAWVAFTIVSMMLQLL